MRLALESNVEKYRMINANNKYVLNVYLSKKLQSGVLWRSLFLV